MKKKDQIKAVQEMLKANKQNPATPLFDLNHIDSESVVENCTGNIAVNGYGTMYFDFAGGVYINGDTSKLKPGEEVTLNVADFVANRDHVTTRSNGEKVVYKKGKTKRTFAYAA